MQLRSTLSAFVSEVKFVVLVLACMAVFRTAAYGMYHIPSESMLPALQVGDRVAVSKFAYGYSRHTAPFSVLPNFSTPDGRIFSRLPERGDVVVFKHPRTKMVMIKRLIALPGDTVALKQGRLYVNGAIIERTFVGSQKYREHRGQVVSVQIYQESLSNGESHVIFERGDYGPGDDMAAMTLPEGYFFVMGDNRDNSLDSRFALRGTGIVPADHLIGKSIAIPYSTHRCRKEQGLTCRRTQWFSAL